METDGAVDSESVVYMDGDEVMKSGLSNWSNRWRKLGWLRLKAENRVCVCLYLRREHERPAVSQPVNCSNTRDPSGLQYTILCGEQRCAANMSSCLGARRSSAG